MMYDVKEYENTGRQEYKTLVWKKDKQLVYLFTC